MLSLVALVLAAVWLGNAAVSILLRNPYPIATLEKWIPIALMIYALWHVLKVAWKRPETAIEWTAAEQALVCDGPFSRRHVLVYRLGMVMRATVLKALFVSLLLMADFPIWPVGFAGVVLALAFLELLRMTLEISTHGVRRSTYLLFRTGVFGIVGTMAACALVTALRAPLANGPSATAELLRRLFGAAMELRHTGIGALAEAPFVPFSQVITTSNVFRPEFVTWVLLALLLVAGLLWLVFWLDRVFRTAVRRAEAGSDVLAMRLRLSGSTFETPVPPQSRPDIRLRRIPRFGGVGPLVWRQGIGAFGHRFGLLTAFLPPTVLALLPLAVPMSSSASFLQVAGGLVFYTSLLLPAALRFDFRRDYDRLGTFKTLPVSPRAVVAGQVATPVVMASLFQLVVLLVAAGVRPVSLAVFCSTLALLLPLNVLIFSLENLIFLLSPCRPSQEGIEVFLRSILVFTAKGLFLAAGFFVLFLWSRAAHYGLKLSRDYLGLTLSYGVLFTTGICILVSLLSLASWRLLVRTYNRFDPSLDGDR